MEFTLGTWCMSPNPGSSTTVGAEPLGHGKNLYWPAPDLLFILTFKFWIHYTNPIGTGLVAGRIHVVDATTLASEGSDAGTVLVLWFDQCGRAIRYSREPLEDASDIANVSDAMVNEYSCWANAHIGQSYEWGAPLGLILDKCCKKEV
ncbi:unnamed protein product [Penicillium bialowiezense]